MSLGRACLASVAGLVSLVAKLLRLDAGARLRAAAAFERDAVPAMHADQLPRRDEMTAADAVELRTLPRLARSAAMAQAAGAAQASQRRFARTASNLCPATPLDRSEEDKQRMAGALAVTEVALIARAQAGDHAAFETIFTQYQTQIYNYIYRLMGSAED